MLALAVTPEGHAQDPTLKTLPVSGLYQPELASFDELMADFMRQQQVPGAASDAPSRSNELGCTVQHA